MSASIFGVVTLMIVSGNAAAAMPNTFSWRVILPANSNPQFGFETNLVFNPAGYEMALAPNGTGIIRTYALQDGKWVDLQVRSPQNFGCGGVFGPYLVNDERDGYILLVEAYNFPPPCDGPSNPHAPPLHVLTWKFQGGVWAQVDAQNAPLASYNDPPTVVYDASDGYVLLYGGDNGGNCICETNRTWSYHGGIWTQSTRHAPTELPFELLFDPALGKILLLSGGYWTFHAGIWERIFPLNRPDLKVDFAYQAGYDVALGALVVGIFSAHDGKQTWLWKAGATGFVEITSVTTNPGVLCSSNGIDAVYDPALSGLICQGANGDLWEFT